MIVRAHHHRRGPRPVTRAATAAVSRATGTAKATAAATQATVSTAIRTQARELYAPVRTYERSTTPAQRGATARRVGRIISRCQAPYLTRLRGARSEFRWWRTISRAGDRTDSFGNDPAAEDRSVAPNTRVSHTSDAESLQLWPGT